MSVPGLKSEPVGSRCGQQQLPLPTRPMGGGAAATSSASLDAKCPTRVQGHVKAIEWQYQQTGPHEGALFPVSRAGTNSCLAFNAGWPCCPTQHTAGFEQN